MSRWDRYVDRIDEKVSRDEIDAALSNNNILCGVEFEFKLNDENTLDMGDNAEATQIYNSAYQDVEEYNKAVRRYEAEVDNYENETREMENEKEALDDKKSEFEDAISDAESTMDDWTNQVNGFISHLKDLEDSINDANKSSVKNTITNLKSDTKKLQDKINKETQDIAKFQKEIDDIDKKISKLDDELKSREDNKYEEVESPYFDEHNYPDYFDYMTNWVGSSKKDLYVEPGELADFPYEWEEDAGGNDDFEGGVEKSGILKSAPFKSYKIGVYGEFTPNPGESRWAIEPDPSVSDGIEIKSPPMELPKMANKTLKEMFDWINKIGYTDSECGFHCHMSVKNPAHELDYVKLIMFTDEGFIYKSFSDRAGSFYAQSAKEKLKTQGIFDPKNVSAFFKKKDLIMKSKLKSEHYDAISVIDPKTGHVEFRYMGSGGYTKKYDEVRAIMGVYAHNLSLAMDPNYKRKEYITKIQRVDNKTELFMLGKRKDVLEYAITSKDLTEADIKVTAKMLKDVMDRIGKLSMYKLDSDTIKGLSGNKDFYRSMKLLIMNDLYKVLSKPVWDYVSKAHLPEL